MGSTAPMPAELTAKCGPFQRTHCRWSLSACHSLTPWLVLALVLVQVLVPALVLVMVLVLVFPVGYARLPHVRPVTDVASFCRWRPAWRGSSPPPVWCWRWVFQVRDALSPKAELLCVL